MTKFPYALVVLSAALAACADKGATDTADTVADSVDTVDTVDTVDSETSDTVTANIALLDALSPTTVPGGSLTFNGESLAADASGNVNLQLPKNSTLRLSGDAPGYMTSTLVLFTLDETITTGIVLLQTAARDALSTQLGIPYDPTKGILAFQSYTWDESGKAVSLGGTTVDLDVAYSIALATDQRAPGSLVPSNVTVTEADSNAQITFINVPAGPVNVTVTPPAPYTTCTWYRGDTRVQDYAVEVVADIITQVFAFCE